MTDPGIQQPKPAGRSEFSIEVLTAICERMSEGESLREICDKDPDLPARRTILRWVKNDDAAKKIYDEAQLDRMHWYADEIVKIAYDTSNDTIKGKDGQDLCNHEWIARSRLKVDSLKFLMAKLAPRTYGDKLPETVEDRNLKVSWENGEREGIDRIERVIVRRIIDPVHDDSGAPISGEHALRARIAELEQQLDMKNAKPAPPRQITYDPGPLPSRTEGQILCAVAQAIKRNVPKADQRPAEEVISEVMAEFERLLQAKYAAAETFQIA
jgi:hypothetical protein